ncbi:MAG: hypothetical protein ACI9D8_001391, partial [Reinekea sp.]
PASTYRFAPRSMRLRIGGYRDLATALRPS